MDGIITAIFYTAIIAGLLYVIRLAARYLTAKINAVKDDECVRDKQLAQLGLDVAEKAIKTVTEATVGKLEELRAKDIRKQIENGEADISNLKALAGEAYDEVVAMVQPELIESLSGSLRDVEAYIRNQIEHQLGLLKRK